MLVASTGAWSGTAPISYAYQWQLCKPGCTNIAGATGSSLGVSQVDVGGRLRVVVTASNSAGSTEAGSNQVGPVAQAGPTAAQIRAALAQALVVSGKFASIAQLIKRGGYPASFTAPSVGHLVIGWYFLPPGARLANAARRGGKQTKAAPVLVASANVVFHAPGRAAVQVALTAQGRRLLQRAQRLVLTERGSFVASGATTPTSVTRTITLTQRRRHG
jgi:hypothetical protein